MRSTVVVFLRSAVARVGFHPFAALSAATGTLFLALCAGPVVADRTDRSSEAPSALVESGGPNSEVRDAGPDDTCSGATILPFLLSGQATGDLSSYTNDYDPGVPGPSCTGHAAPGRDLVLAVDLTCGSGITLYYYPTGYDASIYIVRDCLDIAGTCVVGADANGVGGHEEINLQCEAGGTYYIIVDAHDPDSGGPFAMSYDFYLWDIPPGACCFADGHCEMLGDGQCVPAGGLDLGPCHPCEPNPCIPTPAERTSWGRIKETYR